jgi:SAM-dependent methyltransferase
MDLAVKPAIAVLPFADQGADPARYYLADGLTQDLINSMGRFSALTVMSRNAVAPYKGGSVPPGEIARVLKPGGLLLFSTFGPGTLAELRDSWASAGDARNHVNHFFDPHALGSALMQASLAEPVLDVDRIVERYPDVMSLMRELKAIGAHNVTQGRPRGLTGRKRLTAMTQAYETLRVESGLPATYEVIHAICWGSDRRAQDHPDAPGETFISPGAIRRRTRS